MKLFLIILLLSLATCVKSQTEFGIICGDCSDNIAAAKKLGVDWLRISVELNDYKGRNILKKYYDSGINNLIVTVKWLKNKADIFVTDTVLYKTMLDSFIRHNNDTTKKLFLVIGNEELNETHTDGTAQDYINELNAAITVASKYNLSISNGGLSFAVLKVGIFVSMMDEHTWDKAYKFAHTCIPDLTIKRLQNKGYKLWDKIHFLDTIVNGLSAITYPNFYTNFHYYSPAKYSKEADKALATTAAKDTLYTLTTTVNWLQEHTNRDSAHVMSNEIGQLNDNADLTKSILRNAKKVGLPIVIWLCGKKYGLFENYETLELKATGKTFKNFVNK